MTATVLLLESEASLRKVVTASLQQDDLEILPAPDAGQAHRMIREESPDVFVVELDHPAGDTGGLIEAYRRQREDGAVLLTTTERPEQEWRQRYQPEIVVYKPFDVRVLSRRVRRLIRDSRTEE